MKKLSIGIGAIFRDEFPYVLEWLAWHQLAGFEQFYIADNGSSDGTVELLEALQDLGYVKVLYQPVVETQAQLIAYQRIAAEAVSTCDAIMFIDADEFVTHSGHKPGAEVKYLRKLFREGVGTVSINWRVFGSSGHEGFIEAPVTERFTRCAEDRPGSKNGYLKSATLTRYIKNVGPHRSGLSAPLREVDANGNDISGFVVFEKGQPTPIKRSGALGHVVDSPIRVNHYAVKSFEEYSEKKRRRGSSMHGVNHDKGEAYFRAHDLNDHACSLPAARISRLKRRMAQLTSELNGSIWGAELIGNVDISNRHEVQGWVCCKQGSDQPVRVQVFVNGCFSGSATTGFFRSDLLKAKVSRDGIAGFKWRHPKTLSKGDLVEVRVYGNRFAFPKRAKVVVG